MNVSWFLLCAEVIYEENFSHKEDKDGTKIKQPTYSKTIKSFRVERTWSQEQLAQIARVSTRTIQRIESGEPASFETLEL